MPITIRELDLTGLKCPMPIVKLAQFIRKLQVDDEFTAYADDHAFCLDVKAWCNKTGHELVAFQDETERLVATIKKK